MSLFNDESPQHMNLIVPDIYDDHKQLLFPLFATGKDVRRKYPDSLKKSITDDSVITICPICAYPMGVIGTQYVCKKPDNTCNGNVKIRGPEMLCHSMSKPLSTIPTVGIHMKCKSVIIGVSTSDWSKGQVYVSCGCQDKERGADRKNVSLDFVEPSQEQNREKRMFKESFDFASKYYAQTNKGSKPIKDAAPIEMGPKGLW